MAQIDPSMTTTNEKRAHAYAKIAELSLIYTALGNGIRDPFDEFATPSLIVTSALAPSVSRAYARAENAFLREAKDSAHAAHEEEEQQSALPPAIAKALLSDDKKKKKDKRMYSLITWRDPGSCRATILEMMNRSKYRTLTLMDEQGARLAMALTVPAKTASEGALVSLTGDASAEVAVIRSAVSGGATIHGALQHDTKLNYFSCVNERTLKKMRRKLPKQTRFIGWLRNTVMIPGNPNQAKSELNLNASTFSSLFRKFLACPSMAERKNVTVDNMSAWEAFFSQSASAILARQLSPAAIEKLDNPVADVETILYHASRVAIAEAALNSVNGVSAEVVLDDSSLRTAQECAEHLLYFALSIDVLDQRAENAANARSKLNVTPGMVMAATKSIMDAIDQRGGMISRRCALSLTHVTPTVLQAVLENGLIRELCGAENINMGRTTRAYVIASNWEVDEDEANDDFEAACEEFFAEPTCVDEATTKEAAASIADKAEQSYRLGRGPIVRLTQLSHTEMSALPKILKERPDLYDKQLGNVVVRKSRNGDELGNWNLPLRYGVDRWTTKTKEPTENTEL